MQFDFLKTELPLKRANEYLIKKKNTKAIKHLNKLIDNDPGNEEAWLLLGIAKRRLGSLEGAIECFKIVTELNTSMIEAWGLLTVTHMDNENYKMAEEVIEKAVQLNPNNEKIQFYQENLIRVYKKFGPFF